LRSAGFEVTEELSVEPDGAVSAVLLSVTMPIAATPAGNPHTILNLTAQGTAPPTGVTETWTVSFVDGLRGSGEPVENMIVSGGLAFLPALTDQQNQVTGL
jgi:hypothetical protein